MAPGKNYNLKLIGRKVIAKSLIDSDDPKDYQEFFKSYEQLVKSHTPKTIDEKLLVLFDIKSVTVSLFKPKLRVLSALTEFFLSLTKFSIDNVSGVGIMLSNDNVIKLIQNGLRMFPSKVDVFISKDLEECKNFLKNCKK
jgi:hypothetical protein